MDKQKYHFEKLSRRKTGFPLATISYYGPDNQFASKVVVGIMPSEKDKKITELKKWFAKDLDVRKDPTINTEILAFLETNQIHRIASMGNIIGCPHEEGIDYPEGEKCPHCPFWANHDRWTGEIIE